MDNHISVALVGVHNPICVKMFEENLKKDVMFAMMIVLSSISIA